MASIAARTLRVQSTAPCTGVVAAKTSRYTYAHSASRQCAGGASLPSSSFKPSNFALIRETQGLTAGRRNTAVRRELAVVAMAASDVAIMINDASGKMGTSIAEAVLRAGYTLVPYFVTGRPGGQQIQVGSVKLQGAHVEQMEAITKKALAEYPGLIVVDFTLPSAVNGNAEFYVKHGLPFVMGTTGGDREKLMATVKNAGTYAVIAPNMGKQIVAFQAAMENLGREFPGSFSGYKLRVVESHQATKVDTSGTAKAVVASLQKLGLDFDMEQIEMVRTEKEQLALGVPKEALNGHAFHTYYLTSPDGSVDIRFTHNVVGRDVYAEGAVDACVFLKDKIQKKDPKKLYDMFDILRSGMMR
eukprot:jgi/Mesvir1/5267/Mv15380-RA.1